MGFFSWLTADTRESIPCKYSSRPVRPVFLLQPEGRPPIRENDYEGYGTFGGVVALTWLAENNLPEALLRTCSPDQLFEAGIGLEHGGFYLDIVDRSEHMVFHDYRLLRPTARFHSQSYAEPVPGYHDKCANDLLASGRWLKVAFSVYLPLKFSFDENAVYESLSASDTCPEQGYFYENEEEED